MWLNCSRTMLCYAMLSHFSRVQLCVTPRWQPTRLPRPWDSPGKNTGVGCHFLLQCMKVKRESEVTQSCPTLATPWTAARQAPPSMGFSRQEYWSGVPLPSPVQGLHTSIDVVQDRVLHQWKLVPAPFPHHPYDTHRARWDRTVIRADQEEDWILVHFILFMYPHPYLST